MTRDIAPTPLYRHAGGVLLRAAALSLNETTRQWPELDDSDACRSWLRQAWQVHGFADAVRHASPLLAGRVDAVLAGETVDAKTVRRATAPAVRYLLRAVGRATPFGLFAGVAPVSLGPTATVRWGNRHRAVARVDMQWLAAVIDRLEAIPDLVGRLEVVGNDLAVCRGHRWEVPRGADRVSVRRTPAVELVRAAATSPIRFSVLTGQLVDAFIGSDPAAVHAMLTGLLRAGFLISELRAPLTVVDPLGHLLDRLGAACAGTIPAAAAVVGGLQDTRNALRGCADTAARALVSASMRHLSTVGRAPLAVDLRVDCAVQLPQHVVDELARAAGVLLRLTRQPAGEPIWQQYHAVFRDRYGVGAVVPVREVVDPDSGLGYPAGYPGSVHPRPPSTALERDERLLALAWQAVAEGTREIDLTPATIKALTGVEFDPSAIPPHVEIAARIHATSAESLTRGDYQLTVAPARAAGTLTSRFTPIAAGSGLEQLYATVPVGDDGALAVQLSFPPMYPHAENICRVPAYLPHLLSIGEHRPSGDGVLTVDDLGLLATGNRLHLVRLVDQRIIEPQVFHALALDKQPPPLARFLAHLTRAFQATWLEFDWGPHAHRLPYLPRVRTGRTVLSPTRWRLTGHDLPTAAAGPDAWRPALEVWRQRWRCSDTVELRTAEGTLRLNFAQPAHLAVLRSELQRTGEAVCTETVDDVAEYGWVDGHAHEIVIPLVRAGPPAPPPLVGAAAALSSNRRGHLPGSADADWLSAKIFTHPERIDELITDQLPQLLAALDGNPDGAPAYWFVRYRSLHESDHLRLRLHTPKRRANPALLAAVGDWAQRLRNDGIAAHLVFDSYFPEIGRYGDGPALATAEGVFAADSQVVATALRQLPVTGLHRTALAATGILDIAEGFLGTRDAAAAWLIAQPGTTGGNDRAIAAQVIGWAAYGRLPDHHQWPTAVTEAMHARTVALQAYRRLEPPGGVLASLLHLHVNRVLGINPDDEAACRRLARKAALAWRARQPGRAR